MIRELSPYLLVEVERGKVRCSPADSLTPLPGEEVFRREADEKTVLLGGDLASQKASVVRALLKESGFARKPGLEAGHVGTVVTKAMVDVELLEFYRGVW